MALGWVTSFVQYHCVHPHVTAVVSRSQHEIPGQSLTLTPTPRSAARRRIAAAIGDGLPLDHATRSGQRDQTFDLGTCTRWALDRVGHSRADEKLEWQHL
jgi:hypothetical protein